MGNMLIEQRTIESVSTNCYFLINEKTNETIIIDPADKASFLKGKLIETGRKPVAILLTHGHFDHMFGAKYLAEQFQIPIYAHEAEQEILEDTDKNVSYLFGNPYTLSADCYVKDGQILNIAGFSIKVLHTPGHTKGGVCYYIEDEQVLISGDTLFSQSVGRSDFPTGSGEELVRSIREKLFLLPDETKVYPGHMGQTTIGYEKKNNPFVQ